MSLWRTLTFYYWYQTHTSILVGSIFEFGFFSCWSFLQSTCIPPIAEPIVVQNDVYQQMLTSDVEQPHNIARKQFGYHSLRGSVGERRWRAINQYFWWYVIFLHKASPISLGHFSSITFVGRHIEQSWSDTNVQIYSFNIITRYTKNSCTSNNNHYNVHGVNLQSLIKFFSVFTSLDEYFSSFFSFIFYNHFEKKNQMNKKAEWIKRYSNA